MAPLGPGARFYGVTLAPPSRLLPGFFFVCFRVPACCASHDPPNQSDMNCMRNLTTLSFLTFFMPLKLRTASPASTSPTSGRQKGSFQECKHCGPLRKAKKDLGRSRVVGGIGVGRPQAPTPTLVKVLRPGFSGAFSAKRRRMDHPVRSRDHPMRGHMRELSNTGRLTICDFHSSPEAYPLGENSRRLSPERALWSSSV